MQVGGLLTTCTLLLRPHTPSTQPCYDSRMAGPACPACSSPGEGTACQRISSQPSIYFLPVCTLSWFTCEESRSTSVQDVTSLFLNFPPPSTLSLSLSFPWVSHTRFSTLISGCMLFLLHHSAITLLPYFVYLSVCLLFCFFPFPRFSPVLHPWSRARRAAHRHTEPRPNLPLSLSLPVDACLCLGLRLRPAPIVLPHQHIYCTCLLAPCHPHTHSSPSFTERFWQRVKKKIMQT